MSIIQFPEKKKDSKTFELSAERTKQVNRKVRIIRINDVIIRIAAFFFLWAEKFILFRGLPAWVDILTACGFAFILFIIFSWLEKFKDAQIENVVTLAVTNEIMEKELWKQIN